MSDVTSDRLTRAAPAISVIVPVYNRAAALRRLLAALSHQALSKQAFEVLVCDDGSSNDIASVVQEYQQQRLKIRHIRQTNRGPAAARNLGIAAARAPLLAFTDSDCEPAEDWLEQLVCAFRDPALGLAGGRIEFRAADHLSGRCLNFLMSSSFGGAGARDPEARLHMKYYPRTGNLAVRSELARGVGGFSQVAYGEDIGFSQRLLQSGARVMYVAGMRVLHNERRSLWQAFGDARGKGGARVRLARTQGMHELIHMAPAVLCLYLVIAALAVPLRPDLALPALAPGAAYCLILGILAIQGGASIGSLTAALCIPFYAVAMHLGYGLGYWTGWAAVVAQAICRRWAPRGRGRADRDPPAPAPAAPEDALSTGCAQYGAMPSPPCSVEQAETATGACQSEVAE